MSDSEREARLEARILDVALEAAEAAGKLIRDAYLSGRPSRVSHKAEFDLVTEVDERAEEVLLEAIGSAFPDQAVLSEETGRISGASDYAWIVDPLDGTNNFVHRVPIFTVSVAAVFKGEPVVGVVFDPMRSELFHAIRGGGAFLNRKAISVSPAETLAESLVATGFPFRSKHRLEPYMEAFKSVFLRCQGIRRMGSAALDLAYCAAGRFEAFFELGLNPWDIAAGCLLVEEAGGEVGSFGPSKDHMETGDVLATNGMLHQELKGILDLVFG